MKNFNKIKGFLEKYPYIFPVISAILLSFSFPPSKLYILSFFGLIPFFYFLEQSKSKKQAIIGSLIFSFIYYGWIIRWFFSTLPLNWIGVSNDYIGFLTMLLIWMFSAGFMALLFCGFGIVYQKLNDKFKIILIPAAWVIFEYLTSLGFGLIWAGESSLVGPYWSFGSLGYLFSLIPSALYFAKVLGLYGASFVIVYLNIGFYFLFKNKKRQAAKVFISLILFLLISVGINEIFFKPNFKETENKSFSVIQTYSVFPDSFLGGFFSKGAGQGISLMEKINPNSKNVVLPEGGFSDRKNFEERKPEINKIFSGKKIMIFGNIRPESGQSDFIEMLKYDVASGEEKIISQKTLLAPFGEYVPFIFWVPIKIFGGNDWISAYSFDHPYKKGNNFYSSVSKEAVILCSSVFAPSLWEDASRRGAEIFILPASQWFFKGSSFYGQVEANLRFFAAENNRWMIEAANGGYSYIIDNNGNIKNKSKSASSLEILEGDVSYIKGITFATYFKNWAVWISTILLAIFFLFKKINISKLKRFF